MANTNEVYRCNLCGNIVWVVHPGVGQLVCCGKPMELMTERTAANEGVEKRVPVVAEEGTGVLAVKVGSVEHPMSEEHYIEWIEVQEDNGNVQARFLNPQDKPFARFELTGKPVKVRAYCNLHGLWKA
jgi:superoxide reductase